MTKDGLLKKAAEDMKWFKLELVNRDKAYTEIFGNNPNVGNIDPRLMQAQNVSLFWFIWVARKTKSPSEIRKYGTRSRRQECTAQLREKELQDERMNNINLMDTPSNFLIPPAKSSSNISNLYSPKRTKSENKSRKLSYN